MKWQHFPWILIGLGIILGAIAMVPLAVDLLTTFLLLLATVCGLITLGCGIALIRK
jgi:hypothetical protein